MYYKLQISLKFKRFDGLELLSPNNACERIWLRYTPSNTGFTINVPGQHQHNESELFANFMKTQTLNMTLKNQFAVWNHWQKVTKKMYCLYCRYSFYYTHALKVLLTTFNLRNPTSNKSSRVKLLITFLLKSSGELLVCWSESKGREFETNLPPAQPSTNWGVSNPRLPLTTG